MTNELNVNDKAYMIIDHENQASIKAVLKIGFAKKNPIKKTKTKRYVIT